MSAEETAGTRVRGAAEVPARVPRSAVLPALLRVHGYPQLFASSLMWHTTRWGGLFTTSYLLTRLVHSPLAVQFAGALIFAPMLLGGFLAGAISDRLPRRRMILWTQSVLVPVEVAMFAVVQSGQVRVWMSFPFMFALGIGGLVNMTAQRPLIYEIVGPDLAPTAMTIEATAQAGSSMIGTAAGGLLIARGGMGAGFGGMAALLCLSLLLLAFVRDPAGTAAGRSRQTRPVSAAAPGLGDQLRGCAALLRRSRRLVGSLAVTIVMNLLGFGYIPLVPLVAERFGAGAEAVGLLAAATGAGQILCGLVLSTRRITRHGLVFASGASVSLIGLLGFGLAPSFGLAFAALFVGGLGQGAFAAMQSLLAIESAGSTERGAALGLLSTSIGALPIGTVLMGVEAVALGTRRTLVFASLTGLVLLAVTVGRARELIARR